MPATKLGGGDQLARGMVRASFGPPDVTEDKWKQAFADVTDAKTFVEKPAEKVKTVKANSDGSTGRRD